MAPASEGLAVTWHLEKHGVECRGGQGRADQEPCSHGLGFSRAVTCRRVSLQTKGPKGRPPSLCWQHWSPDPGKWKRGACPWLGQPRYHSFNPISKMDSLLSLSPKHKCLYYIDLSTSIVRILKIMPSSRPRRKLLKTNWPFQWSLSLPGRDTSPFLPRRLVVSC